MDGLKRPPFVFDQGLSRGVLHLIVIESGGGQAYGVEIKCEMYGAFEEMIYSVAFDDGSAGYDGTVYIKEAETGDWWTPFKKFHPNLEARRFLFVGGDYCFETIGFTEPKVRVFASAEEAYAWPPLHGAHSQ